MCSPLERCLCRVPMLQARRYSHVIHAVQDSFSEAYVRRHLLFTSRNRVKYHQNWQRVTTVALIPLSPLALSPFPNLPIYYAGYRVYSHSKARAGATAVLEYLEHLETYKPSAPDPDSQLYNKGVSHLHNSFDYSVTAHVRFRPCADLSEVAASRERYATLTCSETPSAVEPHLTGQLTDVSLLSLNHQCTSVKARPLGS